MKKEWKNYDQFRHLEPTNDEFLIDQERILDGDHNWTPKTDGEPPIGGEYAIVDKNRRT